VRVNASDGNLLLLNIFVSIKWRRVISGKRRPEIARYTPTSERCAETGQRGHGGVKDGVELVADGLFDE